MAKKEWTTCEECETEFRVISDNHNSIAYCPYCGYELEFEDDEDEWNDE
jgi:uncharacterized paraquat-inducible protein A